jgi:regulator of cell morphogenesis and NO signaling
MNAIRVQDTVGEVVARRPALSRVFAATGVDYCCGGKRTLDEVCREKGFDPQSFLAMLEQTFRKGQSASDGSGLGWRARSASLDARRLSDDA